ncbi:putative transmembrane protein [Sesbania bispinosa]|nr:putative transmembrane protein [Sesbania bispinosa]
MATLGVKLPLLCCLIISLMLLEDSVCATRSKFASMEQEKGRGASMLMVDQMTKLDSGKGTLFLLAKGHVPPSGPSHRGHNAPQFAGHFNHRSP